MNTIDFNKVAAYATNAGYIIAGAIICYFVVKKKISDYLQEIKDNLNVGSKIPKQAKSDMEIIKRMEQVKEILNADRVQVFEFHNGEHYANGRSALKFSCTYEVYRAGVTSVQTKLSSIPISCVPHFVTTLLDGEFVKIKDLETIKDAMPATYEIKKSIDISSFQDLIIRNGENEPVGFIEVQWCKGSKMKTDDRELYRLATYVEERILSEMK